MAMVLEEYLDGIAGGFPEEALGEFPEATIGRFPEETPGDTKQILL